MPKLLENDQPTSSARWLARNETNSERRFRPTTQKKSTQNINNTESSASKAHTNQASKPKTLQPNYSNPAAELLHQSLIFAMKDTLQPYANRLAALLLLLLCRLAQRRFAKFPAANRNSDIIDSCKRSKN